MVYGQDSIKNAVGWSAKMLTVDILGEKNFVSKQRKKTVIASVHSIYSLCNKIEGHRLLIAWIFFRSRMKQALNDAFIYGSGLKEIYLNRCKQKMFIVFIRLITYCSLIFSCS